MKISNPTILVVDDEPASLFFMQDAFKALGRIDGIHLANGGPDAVAYLKGQGKYADRAVYMLPDFVITDLKMPLVDGFEMIRFIKQNPLTAAIPVVVFSGSRNDSDIMSAYLLGANSFHVKPVGLSELRALVKALYDYWATCEVPDQSGDGWEIGSTAIQKLGRRYFQAAGEQSMLPQKTGTASRSDRAAEAS
jgi:CheY-like chemotaxis protein